MTTRYAFIAPAAAVLPGLIHPPVCSAQLAIIRRTPELERLEVFVGRWQRIATPTPRGGPSPVAAQIVARWGPGEVWMTWDAEIQFGDGQTPHGRRQMAWDDAEGVYRSSWIDTQSAQIIKTMARWDEGQTFEIQGEPIVWPDGHTYRFKTQYELVSSTQIRETGWRSIDGGPYQQPAQAMWTKNGG